MKRSKSKRGLRQPEFRGEYAPEMAQSWVACADETEPGTFFIRPGLSQNAWFMRIQVNPALNADSQERIANFVAHAPYLWQDLRETLNSLLWLKDFEALGKMLESLQNACDRTPIANIEHHSDDDIAELHNAVTLAELEKIAAE